MVEIRQTPMGGNLREFLDVVTYIYRDDPHFVRPLDMDLKDRLDPRKNPFFEHGEGIVFTAHRNGKCIGRVTASIDHEHLDRYKDEAGFFGFFDTIDDEEVARALLTRAEDWLRAKKMKVSRGPLSLNINEELGCLVSGFDSPPFVMMPHHRPYQAGLIEKAGYAKEKDFFAWSYAIGELNARTKRAYEEIKAMPEVTHRAVSLKNLARDVELFVDIFNDAWSDNWSYVPFSRREIQKLAQDFRLLLTPEITCIVSIDGEPAGVAVAIPNLNELVADLNGKLLPFGLPKLLYRLKVRGAHSARLPFLGIRKKWRHVRKYAGLSAFLYAQMNEGAKKLGIKAGELGWTLEDNGAVNAGIRAMGGKPYKRYRVFSKQIGKE
jgi:hypothetical protein